MFICFLSVRPSAALSREHQQHSGQSLSLFVEGKKKKKEEVCSIVIQTPDLAVSPLCAFQNKGTALISVATHHLPHQTEVARQCYCVHFSFFLWGLFIQRRLKFHIPHGRFIKSTNKTTWWQPESFKQLPNSPRRLARGFRISRFSFAMNVNMIPIPV